MVALRPDNQTWLGGFTLNNVRFGTITHVVQSKAQSPGLWTVVTSEHPKVAKRFEAYEADLRAQHADDPSYQVYSFSLKPNERLVVDSQNDDLKNIAYEIFLQHIRRQDTPLDFRESLNPDLIYQRYNQAERQVVKAHAQSAPVIDLDA